MTQKDFFKLLGQIKPYSSREFRIPVSSKRPVDFEPDRPLGDRMYSFIINEWIPKQPDSEILMAIFIHVDFDMLRFARIVIKNSPRGGGKPLELAA